MNKASLSFSLLVLSLPSPEVGIYKRKQESKKTREHAFKKRSRKKREVNGKRKLELNS